MLRARVPKFLHALLLLGGLVPALSAQEEGAPVIKAYTWRDYQGHHQVWGVVEDEHGLLLFGNRDQLLEFDGSTWRKIPVPGAGFLHAVERGPDGRLYVGGGREIGYLEADEFGQRKCVSLLDRLTPAQRDYGDMWGSVANRDGVYFETTRRLLRWDGRAFRVWETPSAPTGELTSPYRVFESDGVVFVHRRGEALWRCDGDRWTELSRDARLVGQRLAGVLHERDGRWLVATRAGDVFTLDLGEGGPRLGRWANDAAAFFQREGLLSLSRLRDGSVLFGTRSAGLVQLAGDGRFIRRLGTEEGLPNLVLHSIAYDRAGRLWLTQNSGLARLEVASGATFFGGAHGLPATSLLDLTRHGGRLHVATGDGVWRLRGADAANLTSARFERVPGLAGRFYALASTPHGLIAAENSGVFLVADDGSRPVELPSMATARMLLPSRHDPDVVWAATLRGPARLRRVGGEWQVERALGGIDANVRYVFEDRAGALWLGATERGVWRVEFGAAAAGGARPVSAVHFFGAEQGVPVADGSFRLAFAGDEPLLLLAHGEARRFDRAAGRFVRAPDAGADGAAPPWQTLAWQQADSDADGEGAPARRVIARDAAGRAIAVLREPALMEIGTVLGFWCDPPGEGGAGGVLWVCGSDGIARVPLGASTPIPPPPLAMLRGAVLAGGARAWPADGVLGPGRHDIVFHYTASAFVRRAEFQTKLEGYDAGWSAGSAERSRSYTNLPPGAYTFIVRARDGDTGRIGPEARLAFTVPPSWWQTWWARGGFALGVAGFVALGVRWRLRLLRQRNERLEATIAARTQELEASREQLVIARDAADAANRAKSTFLAHMSHELRTPLNGILGYAQVLARDPAQPPPARERLRVIIQSGEHLLALINDVLDLARVEAGQLQLRVNDFSPAHMARGVAEMVRARCEERGLALDVRLAPGLPRVVRADEQKLRQVLLNLLGNAVKFTDRGSVSLELVPMPDGRVRFAVEDTGRGIPAEQLAVIFQPFVTTEPREAGTGLGLSLSQSIVELLGGRIQVASEVGRGTRFWFDLPLPEVGSGSPLEVARAPILRAAGPARRILVVDDDATNRAVLRELLEPVGFEVAEAEDGGSALDAVRATPPHAVLLDLRFPRGPDGLAIAQALRAEPGLGATRIIAVSASVFESDRHQALAAGCDAFLAKPFRDEQLFAMLEAQLGLQWVRAQAESAGESAAIAPEPLSAEVRGQLLELARRGDVLRLRARLAELAVEPRHAAEADALDALAAAYQMKRLREVLSSDVQDHPDHR